MSEDFKDHVVKQLRYVGGARCMPMFRDWGLYVYEDLFGIIRGSHLYLRTTRFTRAAFREYDMKVMDSSDPLLKKFYEVPPVVLRSARTLARWAQEAIAIREPAADQKTHV